MTHDVRVEPVMGDDDIARVTLWCQTCQRGLYELPLLFAAPDRRTATKPTTAGTAQQVSDE